MAQLKETCIDGKLTVNNDIELSEDKDVKIIINETPVGIKDWLINIISETPITINANETITRIEYTQGTNDNYPKLKFAKASINIGTDQVNGLDTTLSELQDNIEDNILPKIIPIYVNGGMIDSNTALYFDIE